MTNQHPLTDEFISKNFTPEYDYFGDLGEVCLGFNNDDLRDAYDLGEKKGRTDMLNEVIEWLNEAIFDQCIWPHQIDALPRRLQKAMRPPEES